MLTRSAGSAHGRTRRRALLMALTLALMSIGVVMPASAAHAATGEKCTTYFFEYTDGHVDRDTRCDATPVVNLTSGLHVNSLHVSCSDSFDTPVYDDEGNLLGWDSESNKSDLDGHLIADVDGVPQWGIAKDWTGNSGLDCGYVIPEEPCQGSVTIEVRDADTNALVPGVASGTYDTAPIDLDADASTDAGSADCGTAHDATLTTPPAGYDIVDGDDSGSLGDTDGDTLTLVLTVSPTPEQTCTGDVVIEVRDADTNALVPGAASGTYDTAPIDLDADASTDAGSADCGTAHQATLTTPPAGYDIVDGDDSGSLGDTDGDTLTLVLTVSPTPEQTCTGDVVIEVRDADTNALVPGAASGTYDTAPIDLDADASTDAGSADCGTAHEATLTTPPAGYDIVDGDDSGSLGDTDGDTLTLVLTVSPTPEQTCTGDVVIEVRDAETDDLFLQPVTGTFDASAISLDDSDGVTDAGTYDCGTAHTATLTGVPNGYAVATASDSDTIPPQGGTVTLVLTVVEQPTITPPPPVTPEPCAGGVMIEVRDADTGELVTGAATGTYDGETQVLDEDAQTDVGSVPCETDHTATLDTPPTGYAVVTGTASGSVTEDGELLTLVLTVRQPETGVGGEEQVCEGQLSIVVIAPDGTEIAGPVTLDGDDVLTPFSTGTTDCGEYTVVLHEDELPEGVRLDEVTNTDTAGPDTGATQSVRLTNGDADEVVFVLTLEPTPTVDVTPQPAPQPAPDTAVEDTAQQLPRTGGDSTALFVLALLLLGGGTSVLRLTGQRHPR